MAFDLIIGSGHEIVTMLGAAGDTIKNSAAQACGSNCGPSDYKTLFKTAANILTYLIGAGSVIMIIYGGLRYVISRGDAAQVKAAKETIIYAVVGVVVAILAYAIVQFVAVSLK